MKPNRFSLVALAAAMCTAGLHAQTGGDPLIEQVPPVDNGVPPNFSAPPTARTIPGEGPPSAVPGTAPDIAPTAPADPNAPAAPAAGNNSFGPLEQQKKDMEQAEEGYLIKEANLNDIFQFLAKKAGRQYFHNAKIASPEYRVTGHLNDGNPLQQMEELSFMYGLTLYTKGNTVYALTQAQLAQLPSAEFEYQLRYLRPTDLDQIKALIKPMLSPSGVVEFEPKTNTVVIIDNAQKIEAARGLLHKIDQPRGQIVVETKILRVNSTAAKREGVDWNGSLGSAGTKLEFAKSLNAIFGIPADFGDGDVTSHTGVAETIGNTSLVLSPVQLSGVLRALAEGGLASQVSNPTLITEDNEQATISIIDRVPIVTATQSVGAGSGGTTATEEVRYKIDQGDSTIDKDPEHHREIGISIVVTPTLLPDGTVRMKLRPRSAQITEQIKSALSGNVYPRVTESMVESLARVPDGNSLVVGGFYGESKSDKKNKVPLLGDVPVINFFFKSKEQSKEQTSLVFIVTPTSYNPRARSATNSTNAALKRKLALTPDHDWVDELNPGPAHEPNLCRGIRGLEPYQAPLYPREIEEQSVLCPPAQAPAPAPRVTESKGGTTSTSNTSDSATRFSRARR
ncbi:secretin N-terminal domain-containing protein [Luteolibacter sp. LG18]|uniref:type II secretion system protein GspD n=1 Tax=Luteolibacter sp. LG18 TaxID=2819286 RepID=UPI002B2BA8AC|nr:hypothetical protein llg_29510 [Luteolibacter sp. LG18]